MLNDMITRRQHAPVFVSLPSFGISAFTSRHAPDFYMPAATHAFEKICFVEDGCGELQNADGAVEIEQGAIIRVPAELRHRFVDRPGSPMTLSVLCISPSALSALPTATHLWRELLDRMPHGRRLQVSNSYIAAEYRRLFRSIVLELGHNRIGREAAVLAIATQLIVLVLRTADDHSPPNTSRVSIAFVSSIGELDGRFSELLRISELAEKAGMSYRAYTENFRRYKGMTVTQYVTQRRIEFAKQRMAETGDILGSALESGFGDLSHFYRVFKRQVGYTPQEFIRIHGRSADA